MIVMKSYYYFLLRKFYFQMEQLEETCKRLTNENKELELIVKDSLQENRKLQEAKEALRMTIDRQQQELQDGRALIEVLKNELDEHVKKAEALTNRITDLESSNNEVEIWKTRSGLVPSLKEELASMKNDLLNLEKELHISQRDVNRFKETIEVRKQIISIAIYLNKKTKTKKKFNFRSPLIKSVSESVLSRIYSQEKDVKLDEFINKAEAHSKERENFLRELEEAKSQITKLHEAERERDELISKAAITEETLNALKAELVSEKVL